MERVIDFINNHLKDEIAKAISSGEESIYINFKELEEKNPSLADQVLTNPEETIASFKQAIAEQFDTDLEPRFKNMPEREFMKIKDLRTKHLSKLLYIEGLVRRASEVRPVSAAIIFECPACAALIEEKQTGIMIKEPKRCVSCGRKGNFLVSEKKLEDAQNLVIEESSEAMEGGEQPQQINVFLKKDLVDPTIVRKTCPGSKIRVVGVVNEVPIYLKTGGKSTRFDILMQANTLEPMELEYEDIETSNEDVEKIKNLASDPHVIETLVKSVAPTIYGGEIVKEAIIVQLFGGTKKKRQDGTTVRGDIHVLLVGDPGIAKSQLLKYVKAIAPRARYVSGKGSSAAGLTASVVKDEVLHGWSLEAGTLVLANKGIALIDEIDKMDVNDRVAMHEAMESQCVTIPKANIHATLMAETSILAAANPKLGRFDPYLPIAEQINMPPTLINRFDLIFPLRDLPERERDEKIANHMLQVAKAPEKDLAVLEAPLLRKYIAYAKKKVKPRLTDEAISALKGFYVDLRNKKSVGEDEVKPIPISPRQLEGLIRLSEAYARIRLSDKVEKQDADRAISILKYCLNKVGVDPETGEIDIDRIVSGITSSQRNKIVIVKEIIKDLSNKFGDSVPVADVIEEAKQRGVDENKSEEIINLLKREGEIFEPKHGTIKKLSR